ncbi:MAG: Nif3-like dinuclear metal center hexameric protein [Planctomycetes bacterium]|nr:Nif3-like dinuclear metal center hexameric protein [Planctomycetota bacterium]HPY75383.1 Nif3-like dinuclear metal center hexameric protein [Planctomycetota bacterium]HQB01003.1 Nif3-like dinuclear metal center hexameric protein [Planctomycetota bacterium]
MDLYTLTKYIDEIFAPYFPSKDFSQNGLQVDAGEKVTKIATAVDACMETFKKAAELKAQLLLVHHGLFWGKSLLIQGDHGKRIRFLIQKGISLYGMHLPLDMHEEIGNNAIIAKKMGLNIVKPFGNYNDMAIGVEAHYPEPLPLEKVIERLENLTGTNCHTLAFGKNMIQKIGIVSGGGSSEIGLAASSQLDLFITGEGKHTTYHQALESNLNVVYAGHYATETFGIRALGERLAEELKLQHEFIDVPTGL